MDFINIFFIILSSIVLLYLISSFKSKKRTKKYIEFFFLIIYLMVAIIFIFPNILTKIEDLLGLNSAINFFLYLSIFVLFFIVIKLYHKLEKQREEITKLTRILAINYAKNNNSSKKSK